jgi:hypothetical protein
MSTDAKNPPPRGATRLLVAGVTATHPLLPDSAFPKTFAIGTAATVATGIAACFIPRAAGPAAATAAPPGRTAAVMAEPAGPRA